MRVVDETGRRLEFATRLTSANCEERSEAQEGPIRPECPAGLCESSQLSPRTAKALHHCLVLLAQELYDDARKLGETPVSATDGTFSSFFPTITWRCGSSWRREMARVCDSLADELEAGHVPMARCPAEEFAIWLAVELAESLVAEIPQAFGFGSLPECPEDFAWETVLDRLLRTRNVALLLLPGHDGIEDPEASENQALGMGDYRPEAWFTTFPDQVTRPRLPHQ